VPSTSSASARNVIFLLILNESSASILRHSFMSGIFKLCVQLFGGACCGGGKESRKSARLSANHKRSSGVGSGPGTPSKVELEKSMGVGNGIGIEGEAEVKDLPTEQRSSTLDTVAILRYSSSNNNVRLSVPATEGSEVERRSSVPLEKGMTGTGRNYSPSIKNPDPVSRSVKNEGVLVVHSGVHEQLFDGISTMLATAMKSLSLLICPRHPNWRSVVLISRWGFFFGI